MPKEKKLTFEDYLGEKHIDQYTGFKHDAVDDFNNWLTNLSVDEWTEFGEGFALQRESNLLDRIKRTLTEIFP